MKWLNSNRDFIIRLAQKLRIYADLADERNIGPGSTS